ncbi:DUF881 domain-containing protein [Clostridium aestuarii]|uniref:DUF881 domain-containing protein n=1 Tax=Clostridium aestuarii TaxID=338193 RepID=A0ABT4CXN0_9CLOT|nr:DUF881 domain-containing protein [Clostridium aestuarii]MCY6483721.1 DUF881 domain-containing protein [Clostridium aestuarii]
MKTSEATIFVFMASIIIGIMISSSISLKKINNKVFLTPTQYQEAYDYRKKLSKDMKNLNQKYYDAYSKLQKYKQIENDKSKVLKEMEKEISNNEMILGNTDVVGEGIIINMKDANVQFSATVDPNNQWASLIHDGDLLNCINDLKSVGAEVISVNGQRITNNSSIICWGPFVRLDGVKIPTPFNIKAIGNKDKLFSYMTAEGGYLSYLKLRGININITKSEEVKVSAYEGDTSYKYIKELKKEK